MKNRKELKFICDDRDFARIENRIKGVMQMDAHQEGTCYRIRSVYFDSPEHACFYENQAGVGERAKYRIRIYNCSDSVIRAEIKSKEHDTTRKASVKLTREQFKACMRGGPLSAILGDERREPALVTSESPEGVLHTFAQKITAEGYRPASVVDYERTAFVYGLCNVRVTFDRNIAASADYAHFFEPQMQTVPVCETGMHVLEVKYDEFLPDYIRTLLQTGELRRTSFSKYYLSRLALPGS